MHVHRDILQHEEGNTETSTLKHSFPVEFVSFMACFPTWLHPPQASNKTEIKESNPTCHHTHTHTQHSQLMSVAITGFVGMFR